jgi:hypothetical protein
VAAVSVDEATAREHPRTQQVAAAQADVQWRLCKLQREHGLTDVEMLQAVAGWQSGCLKSMLRAERHPDDPSAPADWE